MEFHSGSLLIMWRRPPGARELAWTLGEHFSPSSPFLLRVLVITYDAVSIVQRSSRSDIGDQRLFPPFAGEIRP